MDSDNSLPFRPYRGGNVCVRVDREEDLMASLKDVLHKMLHLVAGPDNPIHKDIDTLAEDEGKTAVEDAAKDAESVVEAPEMASEDGKEDSPNAAE